jgi:raffinose/stachyose/melibiose transport system permease protein
MTTTQTVRRKNRLQSSGLPWMLPAFVFVVGLIYYSIGYTGFISTLDWNGVSPTSTPVGAGNYAKMFDDPVFWRAIQHTVVFFLVTFAAQTLLGFTFASILHTKVKLVTFHKVIIFIPTVLAPATMAPVFRMVFDANGPLNQTLRAIGLDSLAHPWLADPKTALGPLMLITIWQWTGLTFVLYFAAMSQIEPEMLEAARLDGAGNIRALVSIVWPSCRGTTVALAMLGLIGALKTFDVPYLVTTGGPAHATEFLGTYIYRQGIRQAHIGYAAAISIILLVLAVGGAILMSRINRREVKA